MNKDAIIFAMANPEPEILPDLAKEAGAAVVGTGRSDYPNQINNVLIFPGLFKGALAARAKRITEEMKTAAAYALAEIIQIFVLKWVRRREAKLIQKRRSGKGKIPPIMD